MLGGSEGEEASSCSFDIIIATPGRLVEHLRETKRFSLQFLEFLVMDEVDRLLEGHQYQDWINQVNQACFSEPETRRPPTFFPFARPLSLAIPLRKLLFSATITKNPLKLSQLNLTAPLILCVSSSSGKKSMPDADSSLSSDLQALEAVPKFQTPLSLKEFMLVGHLEWKPLYLLSIIERHPTQSMLVFVKSVEAALRLSILLGLLLEKCSFPQPILVDYLSSAKKDEERKRCLSKFGRREIQVLVCSDALARGIDLPMVDVVINYDAPTHMRTYVHRVGRTARAGRPGTACTLLTPPEAKFFKIMMKESNKTLEKLDFGHLTEARKNLLTACLESFSNQSC